MENTSRSGRAFDGRLSTVGLCDVFDERQTETGTTGSATPRSIDSIESFEQARQMTRLDTNAVVFDTDKEFVGVDFGAYSDVFDRLTVLDGVFNEVAYRLFESLREDLAFEVGVAVAGYLHLLLCGDLVA